MKTIIGLGNPGKKYELTRHNIGFMIIDKFAQKYKLEFSPSKGDYYSVGSVINTSHFSLYKPTTYMNLSGVAVNEIVDNDNIKLDDLFIISDDINLDTGKIRIRESGGDGGHNGLSSIIYHLNSDKFSLNASRNKISIVRSKPLTANRFGSVLYSFLYRLINVLVESIS